MKSVIANMYLRIRIIMCLIPYHLDVMEGNKYLIGKYVKVLELVARYRAVSVYLDYILANPMNSYYM